MLCYQDGKALCPAYWRRSLGHHCRAVRRRPCHHAPRQGRCLFTAVWDTKEVWPLCNRARETFAPLAKHSGAGVRLRYRNGVSPFWNLTLVPIGLVGTFFLAVRDFILPRHFRLVPERSECNASSMSLFERLLVPGSTELPECRCGHEMQLARTEELSDQTDAQIRVAESISLRGSGWSCCHPQRGQTADGLWQNLSGAKTARIIHCPRYFRQRRLWRLSRPAVSPLR